jgi:hypothetical protein
MKKFLLSFIILCSLHAVSQEYYNEWIDYSKTYYKFKVGANGLYRISQSTLAAAGLGSASAEDFQLWRNGTEVPIFTSVATGTLSASDYIEFWGMMNDGKPDKNLYRNPSFQITDKWSLETDTASFFLTVNPGSMNLRFISTANTAATTGLPVEPYFMYRNSTFFKDQMNGGYAVNVGAYMYSSSYDRGEGWTSSNIGTNATLSTSLSGLFAYTGAAPAPVFNIAVSGTATNQRRYRVKINGDSVLGNQSNYFNITKDTTTFPLSLITSGTANVEVANITSVANDRLVIHNFEITYARQFNFGGAANFEFILPASGTGKHLQISGFNNGGIAPVLYDLTNNKRYVGDISTAGMVKFVVEPSSTEVNYVLVSEAASNIKTVNSFQARTFMNYGVDTNQGDYIIISNPLLTAGPAGVNPVEEYRSYRSSVNGGSYGAMTVMIEDITDQFGFGIKKNPIAIRNFLQFARDNFNIRPKFVLLIGKGIDYTSQRLNQSNPDVDRLNLVPSFGSPSSDVMLSSDPGSSLPQIPIGRLSVVYPQEIIDYLNKVKQFELAQQTPSPLLVDKAWMKNIVHVVGASEPALQNTLYGYMSIYKQIIQDTFYGGKVTTFAKNSSNPVDQINSDELDRLFTEGISLLTYFGHSGSSSLEFNLNNPDQYNNTGKYPVFIALGCNAGNFYGFNTARFTVKETLSESFVLAPNKGSIAFIASSHFGIPDYLHLYNQKFYESASVKNYGKGLGEISASAIADIFAYTTEEDFYARATCEETSIHGDPAVKMNPHEKPDYAVEPQNIRVSPAIISVADNRFNVFVKSINIGKAINTNIARQITREYPNGVSEVVYRDTIPGIRYADSLSVNIPIDALRDKGTNRITFTIDADNDVDELFESNNSVTKEFVIYENELRPVFPYNFAIVNKQNIKFYASTANPFATTQTYRFEMDTTEKFNSPLLQFATKTSAGGVIEFASPMTFTDSTVYYWRVSPISPTGGYNWNNSSFIYLPASDPGFNQSHFYQHLKSATVTMHMDSTTRSWKFNDKMHNIFVRNGVFPTAASTASDLSVALDGDPYIRSVCGVSNIIVHVIDPVTFKPWKNNPFPQPGLYGSQPICGNTRIYNFQFSIMDTGSRRRLMQFLDYIPSGYYVVIRNTSGTDPLSNTYASEWKADTNYFGSGNSIYHRMYNQGFTGIDSFNQPRAFIFTYKKDNPQSLTPKFTFSSGILDRITLSSDVFTPDSSGSIISPVFGPAKAWKKLIWKGTSSESPSTDITRVSLLGVKINGAVDTLNTFDNLLANEFDISAVNPLIYPYLQLKVFALDTTHYTPYQLQYWRITYVPKPEGAVAPNILFTMKDTFELGEPMDFKLAFQNISEVGFDSIKIRITITDRNNVNHVTTYKSRPLSAGDTIVVRLPIDNSSLMGMNSMLVDINPDNDQPELHHFNNFIFKNFLVLGDTLNPYLDVTFDNMHIVNGDIVSAKPDILIRLKDDARFRLLDDTSLVTVQVLDPDGNLTTYPFSAADILQFIPAQPGSSDGNTASIRFRPSFEKDGHYELIIKARDKSNNQAGQIAYRIGFEVITKPMISNMLNYPNPFTSSTAFVFTITGSQVPQNIKIQILTVTGKIVREITKAELGQLRVGRNITEFKWDGTDQYGRQLANGVYLYRLVTNLNGKSLDKYTSEGEKTDKFFNKGYGKMYLMR